MSANFKPELTPKVDLQPFRYWCYKILPITYDDSLSYYELLCKVVDCLNKSMEDTQAVITDIDNLNTAYGELQDYVNNYFSGLEVQQMIDVKLDEMAYNGTLSRLIEPLLPNLILTEVQDAIPPLVEDWLDDNISGSSETVIDRSLSTIGAAADAFQAGYIVKALADLNCFDMYAFSTVTNETKNGVTFTFATDGSCTVSGTATADSVKNIWADLENLPEWMHAGDQFTANSSIQSDVRMEVLFYKNGSYLIGWNLHSLGTNTFTVPADAEGFVARLVVPNGTTVNKRVTYSLIKGIPNSDLTNVISYKGPLDNDADPDDISETGLYALTGNTVAPVEYGILFHLIMGSGAKMQIIYKFRGIAIYSRSWNATRGWDAWSDIAGYSPVSCKMLAFGDSLFAGALWNGPEGSAVITTAPEGYRIPDRIAAVVRPTTYKNYAVGGMAYTHAYNDQIPKMIDYMQEPDVYSDILTADLIVLSGGRNDGQYALGTYTDTTDSTICGAINNIIDLIRSVNKTCQIVLVQVTPYTSENHPWTSTSIYGWSLNTFDEQAKLIATNKNIGYASWYGCSLFSVWSDLSGGGGNFAHMKNAKSYQQMGDFIAGKVAGFYHN